MTLEELSESEQIVLLALVGLTARLDGNVRNRDRVDRTNSEQLDKRVRGNPGRGRELRRS